MGLLWLHILTGLLSSKTSITSLFSATSPNYFNFPSTFPRDAPSLCTCRRITACRFPIAQRSLGVSIIPTSRKDYIQSFYDYSWRSLIYRGNVFVSTPQTEIIIRQCAALRTLCAMPLLTKECRKAQAFAFNAHFCSFSSMAISLPRLHQLTLPGSLNAYHHIAHQFQFLTGIGCPWSFLFPLCCLDCEESILVVFHM